MSTYAELQTIVVAGLGRDDTVTQTYALHGLNYAVLAAAIIFSPPELDLITTFTVTGSSSYSDISGITGIRSIDVIYNTTDDLRVWLMSKEKFDILTGALATGHVEYCTRHGNYLFWAPLPDASTIIQVLYRKYPSLVSNTATSIPFDNYDDFLVSEATKFAFACLEEGDSVTIFDGIAKQLLEVHAMDLKKKSEFEEALKSGYSI